MSVKTSDYLDALPEGEDLPRFMLLAFEKP